MSETTKTLGEFNEMLKEIEADASLDLQTKAILHILHLLVDRCQQMEKRIASLERQV